MKSVFYRRQQQARGLNPLDTHDELMEFVKLRGLLWDAEVGCVIEVIQLVTLVRDVSKVLEDFGMSYPLDPSRSAHGRRHLGGGGCDPGAREGGI
jgi:hypothetical protein